MEAGMKMVAGDIGRGGRRKRTMKIIGNKNRGCKSRREEGGGEKEVKGAA